MLTVEGDRKSPVKDSQEQKVVDMQLGHITGLLKTCFKVEGTVNSIPGSFSGNLTIA